MTPSDQLHALATRQPAATALVVTADRVPISYNGLAGMVDQLAEKLRRAGLSPGDRVALRAHSDAGYVVGLLAALATGLVAVPLDPALPAAEQRARVTAAGARAVLVAETGGPSEQTLPCWPISVTADGGAASVDLDVTAAPLPPTAPPEGLSADDATIMFTGGTTGTPKMVPWTHDSIAGTVSSVVDTYRLGPRDATVAVMPLFHGHGLIAALLSTLNSGGTVLLPAGGRFSAGTFWDDVGAVGATWFTAVPTIHRILLARMAADPPERRRETLRFIRSCSAPLDPKTAQELRTEFAAPVLSAFGMTEATHQATSMGLDDGAATAGLVGRSTGPQIRIIDGAGRPCPPGGVGEVQLRGRTVVRGYLANPEATAANFTDDWLHTGDLGSLSAAGELTLRGRIKELINRGGEKISPEHVEDVLAGHPDVAEVAVFGDPDPIYGETVAAVIVPRPGASPTADQLSGFCRDRLAAFEVPASFQVVGGLPHTAKGSVDRRAVADSFGRGPR
ncbi:MAG TPA: FadD7 family fatty acid--CoA ligase [Mycobacterium sp.]|nr:FadD7 family fatty acid--CoA ligase [Mycobacterium sp.]